MEAMNRIFSMKWLRQMWILVMIYRKHLFQWIRLNIFHWLFSLACMLYFLLYIYLFRALLYIRFHALDKFQHIFTLTLNIWLMPIWNGNPHSTKRNQAKSKRSEEKKKCRNIRFTFCISNPIWFGVKRG